MWKWTYAVAGIFVIGFLGLAGALLPSVLAIVFPKFSLVKKVYFSFFNGFAAGVILSVGWIHSVTDAFESLESATHPEEEEHSDHSLSSSLARRHGGSASDDVPPPEDYAWAPFIAMIGVLLTFTVEEIIESVGHLLGFKNVHSHGSKGVDHETEESENQDHIDSIESSFQTLKRAVENEHYELLQKENTKQSEMIKQLQAELEQEQLARKATEDELELVKYYREYESSIVEEKEQENNCKRSKSKNKHVKVTS